MKKAIITTFFQAENYGAALQAYALQETIQSMGHQVEFLNYRDKAIEDFYKIWNWKRETIYATVRSIVGSVVFYKLKMDRRKQFLKFQQKYLCIGKKEYFSAESVKSSPPKADVYITGSDQVWNDSITKGLSDIYTLNFGEKKIYRISYAASIGKREISKEETELFREKLAGIDELSVREVTAKNLLQLIFPEKKICVALDPVLLRGREKWEHDISGMEQPEDYILAYLMENSQECRKTVNELSKKTGLPVIHFEKRRFYDNILRTANAEGPFGFVSLIRHAKYIVTNSFHGTAFSIIFQKKFWVFPSKNVGSRITDLLNLLDLKERSAYSLEEFRSKDFDQEIDYQKVNHILDREREKSLQWLYRALEEGKDGR